VCQSIVFGEEAEMDASSLSAHIQRQLDALDAKTAFFAKHLVSTNTIAIRADDPVNTLSVIKIAIMVRAYQDAEAGTLDLDQRYQIRDDDFRRGSGVLQTFAPGLQPTYRDLLTQMIITSDNTATDILIARLGLARVNTMLAGLGYRETRLQKTIGQLFRRVWELLDPANRSLSDRAVYERGFPSDPDAAARRFAFEGDPREWLGRTTARETARLLEQIHNGEIASRASSDAMLAILQQQLSRSRLPQRIAFRAAIAHKTGDWSPIAGHDVGIISSASGPIVVAVFVSQNRGDFFEVEATHGRIAEAVLDAWSDLSG
jgi:beta-lactamase class A